MKHMREIKVGVVAIVCIFLLFFGFNYLKGVNIFHPANSYLGVFSEIPELTEQAPVYVRGYKVGQVDKITYDFTRDSAFLVEISLNGDIVLPKGTQMALVSDGLLGGAAISVEIPTGADLNNAYARGSYLPTHVVPGLMDNLQNGLLASLTETIENVNALVQQLGSQLDNNHIESVLSNVDAITRELKTTSHDLKQLIGDQVPQVVEHVDSVIVDLGAFAGSLRESDILAKVDTVMDGLNGVIGDVRSQDGTVGKLLYDKSLYNSLNAAVISVDSLVTDIKARPRHYLKPLGEKEKKSK